MAGRSGLKQVRCTGGREVGVKASEVYWWQGGRG